MRALVIAIFALCCAAGWVAAAQNPMTAVKAALGDKHYDAAITLATKALADKQLTASARAQLSMLRAIGLIWAGKGDAAERDIARALNLTPDRDTRGAIWGLAYTAYFHRAQRDFAERKWKLSIADYTAALRYRSDDPDVYSFRELAFMADGDFDAALSDAEKAMRFSVYKSPEMLMSLGAAYEAKLDYDHAIESYSKMIKLAPRDERGWGMRGRGYAIKGEYAKAEADLTHALALAPRDAPSMVWLHLVHLHQGRDDRAWLKAQARKLQTQRWPVPVIQYFLEKRSADDMVRIAWTSPATAKAYQRCDGWFYLGEMASIEHRQKKAKKLFRRTVSRCNPLDYEWSTAQWRLNAMKADAK